MTSVAGKYHASISYTPKRRAFDESLKAVEKEVEIPTTTWIKLIEKDLATRSIELTLI